VLSSSIVWLPHLAAADHIKHLLTDLDNELVESRGTRTYKGECTAVELQDWWDCGGSLRQDISSHNVHRPHTADPYDINGKCIPPSLLPH
jgi:hypothetical protein